MGLGRAERERKREILILGIERRRGNRKGRQNEVLSTGERGRALSGEWYRWR